MEVLEQVDLFKQFIQEQRYGKLLDNINTGKPYLSIDFMMLAKFDPALANLLLEDPENIMEAGRIAAEELCEEIKDKFKRFTIRIKNLPKTQKMRLKDMRSRDIGKLVLVEGNIRAASDVNPRVVKIRFECPSCSNVIRVLQLGDKVKAPDQCGCGRKGKFKELARENRDCQRLVLEEELEVMQGNEQPSQKHILLFDDLTCEELSVTHTPGTKVEVTGIVRSVPMRKDKMGESLDQEMMLEANYVKASEEDVVSLSITLQDKEKILKFSKKGDVVTTMANSFCPDIAGHIQIKKAIILQLFGGVKKVYKGRMRRDFFHLLLIGDPSAGKSQLVKGVRAIAPKHRFSSGKGASGVGLTASVEQDTVMKGGWVLRAGLLPMANGGVAILDELDKINPEDRDAMHEQMEGGEVPISKASIQAVLKAETSILAAANPKHGRFDAYELISKQINMPATLISRFDMIFPIRDIPNEEKDTIIANTVLKAHRKDPSILPELDLSFMKKYIAYARRNCFPELTDEIQGMIVDFYIRIRNKNKPTEDEAVPVPVTARNIEALIRISEAYAKSRLSSTVEQEDVEKAIELLLFSLQTTSTDPETGKLDSDMISIGTTSSIRDQRRIVMDVVTEMSESMEVIPEDELAEICKGKGVSENRMDDIIEQLLRVGDIFRPRAGFLKKAG